MDSEILTSPLLHRFEWVQHGFGTRDAPLSQDGMGSVQQIHSSIVRVAHGPGSAGEGDALVTDVPGAPVSVRTADCLPVLLVDAERHAVGAIHAGWRGTAAGVVREAISKLRSEFGSDPRHIFAAIGPGIGVCCYEVGDDVAQRFGMRGTVRLDLAAANRSQLMEAGVPEEQIEMLRLCTFCDSRGFHSYRRDKDHAGRLISFVGVL